MYCRLIRATFCRSWHLILLLLLITVIADAQYPARLDTVRERIENRDYPSLFGAWSSLIHPAVLDDVPGASNSFQALSIYDVHWTAHYAHWQPTGDMEYEMQLPKGHISVPTNWQRWLWRYNPNMVFLYPRDITRAHGNAFPPDSPFWLRTPTGERLDYGWGTYALNFARPEVQEWVIREFELVAESGLYDGIFIDSWRCCDLMSFGYSAEEETQARTNILAGVRENVHPDFLIVVNMNRTRLEPEHVAYINGLLMETVWDFPPGHPNHPYVASGLYEIERTLIWAAQNLREPILNCLEGFGIGTQPFDSPDNMRWMRLFTTMSLTLDNGTMLYNKALIPGHHDHHWYELWDLKLGQPISPPATLYVNSENIRFAGLYIREYDNAWVVYNRSKFPQEITLPYVTASATTGKYDYIHEVPSMDGDIFLRAHPTGVQPRDRLTTLWGKLKSD